MTIFPKLMRLIENLGNFLGNLSSVDKLRHNFGNLAGFVKWEEYWTEHLLPGECSVFFMSLRDFFVFESITSYIPVFRSFGHSERQTAIQVCEKHIACLIWVSRGK